MPLIFKLHGKIQRFAEQIVFRSGDGSDDCCYMPVWLCNKHICWLYVFSSPPKTGFYNPPIFSTQREEMPIPFENACALQSALYKLTKQNCNFDKILAHL